MVPARQPVHVVYGGAHLFRADVARRLGQRALAAMDDVVPDPAAFAATFPAPATLAAELHARVRRKLEVEPVEDFRADFEDGFGVRTDAEEDREAERVAEEMARGIEAGTLPPFVGIRLKPVSGETAARAERTLALFLARLAAAAGGRLPPGFAVTLPKVESADDVARLVRALDEQERRHGFPAGAVAVELMVETPRALFDAEGRSALPGLVAAAAGRCRGAHFGPYDYTASLSIVAAHQELRHPACDVARMLMQLALAGSSVQLADGPTTRLPVSGRRPGGAGADTPMGAPAEGRPGESALRATRDDVRGAMRAHWDDTRHSLRLGFWQGWDLHPAQLVPRYAAVYSFFLEQLDVSSARLRGFLEATARATLLGDVFDDAATAQGLLNFFRRGAACGALTEAEIRAAGLTMDELASGSFARILRGRRAGG